MILALLGLTILWEERNRIQKIKNSDFAHALQRQQQQFQPKPIKEEKMIQRQLPKWILAAMLDLGP